MNKEALIKMGSITLITAGIGLTGICSGIEMSKIADGDFGQNPPEFNNNKTPQGAYDAAMILGIVVGIGAIAVGEMAREDNSK